MALTSTATQLDETFSSELATIDGSHEGNAWAASSEQVIANSTERRPFWSRPDSFAGRCAHAPQTSYYVDITISITVDLTAVESSVAAVLASAVAATTLLGGDLKYHLSGYSIAIIAAVALLAAVAFCSRLISDSEPKLKTCPNLPEGLPTLLHPLPKLSTSGCLRMVRLVLVLLLCPGVMSTTPDSGPILIHQVGMHAGKQSLATKEAVREAKFHKAEAAAEDPLLFKHRLQYLDAVSNKLTYYEYSARRHDHVLMLDEMNISSCALEVAGGQIQKVQLTSRDHDGLRMNITAGTLLSHPFAPVFVDFLTSCNSVTCRRNDICR